MDIARKVSVYLGILLIRRKWLLYWGRIANTVNHAIVLIDGAVSDTVSFVKRSHATLRYVAFRRAFTAFNHIVGMLEFGEYVALRLVFRAAQL